MLNDTTGIAKICYTSAIQVYLIAIVKVTKELDCIFDCSNISTALVDTTKLAVTWCFLAITL